MDEKEGVNLSTFYHNIVNEMDAFIINLSENKNNLKFEGKTNQTIKEFKRVRNELSKHLQELEINSDWNRFTVALYGETNAGKSTIIETLRIILNETSKKRNREKFDEYQKKYELYLGKYEENLNRIEDLERNIGSNRREIDNLKQKKDEGDKYIDEWIKLQSIIWIKNYNLIKQMCSSFIFHIKVIIGRTQEQKELYSLNNELNLIKQEYKSFLLNCNYEIINKKQKEEHNQKEIHLLKTSNIEINNNLKFVKEEMAKLSDGLIIGEDIDFTREVVEYIFKIDGKEYSLLDLPGIEGKEYLVQDKINKAIEKAHAVFYISSKQRMPQKGDEHGKGTIEKIKEQLSMQTEVFFIFNKRIPSPKQLICDIETEEDINCLNNVDMEMKTIMPNNYVSHITISAYPAFVSMCNNLDGKFHNSRAKFLSQFSKDEIIKRSRICELIKLIEADIGSNYGRKIIKSNFNKIKYAIISIQKIIEKYKNSIVETRTSIYNDLDNVKQQLHGYKNSYINNLENMLNNNTRKYIYNTRKEAYELIDNGINKNDLLIKFKDILKNGEKTFYADVEASVIENENEYRKNVDKIIDNHIEYIEKIFKEQQNKFDIDFDYSFELNIPNKFNIGVLIASLTSVVLNIILSPDHGLAYMIISIVGCLISIGKEIISIFDDDYKIAQQKKSIDKTLNNISFQIKGAVKDNMNKIFVELNEKTDRILCELNNTVVSADTLIEAVDGFSKRLDNELNWLEEEEKKLYERN